MTVERQIQPLIDFYTMQFTAALFALFFVLFLAGAEVLRDD